MMNVENAILSDALVGQKGDKVGEIVGDAAYEIVRTRYEFWNILEEKEDSGSSCDDGSNEPEMDSEGDFHVIRRPHVRDFLLINHTMATTLPDVGLQIWHGALLLCDYLLFSSDEIREKIVLDLGCGTGLTSICAAMSKAKIVYATDYQETALQLVEQNVRLNEHLLPDQGQAMKTRQLDWRTSISKTTQTWPIEEENGIGHVSVILAADVIYDPDLNEALFATIEQLCSTGESDKIILISLEKRFNFTLTDLRVACPTYEHFVQWMENMISNGWTVEKIDTEYIPVCFNYCRNEDMELWRIFASNSK